MNTKYKILVVDDEKVMLGMLKKLLEDQGFEVHLSENPRSALDIFKKSKFDLIITDVLMPGMKGTELIRHIRRMEPAQKIIVITALCESDFQECAAEIEDIQYLGKPFRGSRLMELVNAML